MVKTIEQVFQSVTTMRDRLGVSPTDQFLGHDLRAIYESYFGPAKRERKNGDRNGRLIGPWIGFAVQVSQCLGKTWTAETISKAMSEVGKAAENG
jgi:hypothetical protein